MPSYPGISYVSKAADHMDNVLIRPCPTCGAKVGELCMMKSGRKATKVTEVHSLRFGTKNLMPRRRR